MNKTKYTNDITKPSKAADDYAFATGISVKIISANGELLYSTDDSCSVDTGNCRVCQVCQRTEEIEESIETDSINNSESSSKTSETEEPKKKATACSKKFLTGSYEAHKYGGKYIFFCDMGMAHWASPVLNDNQIDISFVCGPVMIVEPDDYLPFDIKTVNNAEYCEKLDKEIKKMVYIEPKKVSALSEMLLHTAAYFYTGNNDEFFNSINSVKNQAGVSEYIHYIKKVDSDYWDESYPIEKEKEFLFNITSGSREKAQETLNEILGHILFKSGANLDLIKARILELIIVLSRAAIDNGADKELVFGWNYKYIKDINSFNGMEELNIWLSGIIRRFADMMFDYLDVKHVDIMYKATDYIKKNYMKRISLENVSDYVELSPSYFSKIFREEMGISFNYYLNSIRVDNAKQLLLKNEISMVDISNMVGYEDQSYFTKVFKRILKITPGKYRESRGKNISKK